MYKSSISELYKALHARLKRPGMLVGGAGYPRVEIHSITEGEPLDKSFKTREVTFVIESMSTESKGEVFEMNNLNNDLIFAKTLEVEGFDTIGLYPQTVTDMVEVSDTQTIIYRILQNYKIFLTQK